MVSVMTRWRSSFVSSDTSPVEPMIRRAPVPFRARESEAFLAGKPVSLEIMRQAGDIAASEAQPRTSLLRASREYRLEVLPVLVRQGLERAAAQAQARAV